MIDGVRTKEDLTGTSAHELAALVQRGATSPVEVVRAYLDRIERLEPAIAAFAVVRAEQALEEARVLEVRHDLAELPLAGGAQAHWYGMTAFGPLARTVADTALMLDILAGSSAYRNPHRPERALRIAVSTKAPTAGARVAREVTAAVEGTAALLRDAGHMMHRDDPPYPLTLGLRFSRRRI